MRFGIAAVAVSALLATGADAQPLQVRIDRYVRSMVDAHEFQGAVLVARNERVLFARGYGYADRERRVPNTPDTLFRLVMATELFDRIAVLQLRDAGRLALEDSVCRHLAPCPAAWRPITIQALLDHRSGLADVHPLTRRPPSIGAAVDWLRRFPVRPTRRDTSPAATIVLARVIERASRESWLSYIRRHILRPAAMTSTVADAEVRGRPHAVGYKLPRLSRGHDVAFTSPDPVQGLWSTVVDLERLDAALDRGAILERASAAELYPPGEHVVAGNHAWDVGDGFYALVGRHTPDHLLVVLLANGRKLDYRFYEIENRVAALTVGTRRRGPVPAGPAELAFVGPNGVLSISGADGAQPRNLTTIYAGPVFSPTWSPDGRRLAFARCTGPRCSLYLIAADGTGERRLIAGSSPAWSPDGRTLAYAGEDGWIRLVSVASGRSRPLPGPRAGPGNGLAWSPDGRWLLYDGGFYRPTPKHDDLRNRLLLVRAAGGRARVVSRGPGFYLTSNAAWSPDSKSIAYSRRDRVGSSIASAVAFVVPLDGSAAPRPLGGGAYRPPRFTADGAAVAFNLGLGCRLRLVSLGSGTAQTLPFEACEPAWRP